MKKHLPLILKAVVVIGVLVGISVLLPVSEWLLIAITFVRDSGWVGVVAFFALYILATVFLIPGSILTLGAGFIYGPFIGTLIVSPASVLGATAAFLLARGRLRPWVQEKVEGNAKFNAVDGAVGNQGFKIVGLLRLSPVFPFVFLNYALGLTSIKPARYVLASFLGMLPGTFLYTYLGSLVPSVTELAAGAPEGAELTRTIFLWVGFAVTLIVTVFITKVARRALADAVPSVVENTEESGVTETVAKETP